MAIENFASIDFWQQVPAIATIANKQASLITNDTPDPDYQIGTVTPVTAGTMSASTASTTVTRNAGPVFPANGAAGDNLVAYDGANWVNIGTVSTIADDTIVLTAVSANTVTTSAYAFTSVAFRPNYGFYARVTTLAGSGPNARKVPYLRAMRSPASGDAAVLLDTAIAGIVQFSATNDPNGNAGSPTPVDATIDRTPTFAAGTTPGTYFSNSNQFPLYMWYLIEQVDQLYNNTRWDLFFLNTLEAYEVGLNTPQLYAYKSAGYGYF